jgi:hypothetical protein
MRKDLSMPAKRGWRLLLGILLGVATVAAPASPAAPPRHTRSEPFTKAVPWHLSWVHGRTALIGWDLGSGCDPTPEKGPFVKTVRRGRSVAITVRYRFRYVGGGGCFEPDYFAGKRIALPRPPAGLSLYDGSSTPPQLRWRAPPPHAKPWNRLFRVTSVRQPGGHSPFAEPFKVSIRIDSVAQHSIGWEARCNRSHAPLRITRHRLMLGNMLSSTAEQCRTEALEREDEWLSGFFRADPRWRFHGTRLTLSTGHRTMRLDESG